MERTVANGMRGKVDTEILSSKTQESGQTNSEGVSGDIAAKKRGRPRKETPSSNGFTVPAKPEVNQSEKPDPRKFAVIPIRAITDKSITPSEFRALALVASYANRNGFTWVGQETLAAAMGVTHQAISKHIQALIQAGMIEETAKAYWSGPTARTSTLRVIFDPTLTDDDVISRAGSADQGDLVDSTRTVASNISGELVGSTSLESKVVNCRQEAIPATKPDLEALQRQLTAEVLERYRREGLEPPGKWRLAEEVAALASQRARGIA